MQVLARPDSFDVAVTTYEMVTSAEFGRPIQSTIVGVLCVTATTAMWSLSLVVAEVTCFIAVTFMCLRHWRGLHGPSVVAAVRHVCGCSTCWTAVPVAKSLQFAVLMAVMNANANTYKLCPVCADLALPGAG